jgi:hypothetical protein
MVQVFNQTVVPGSTGFTSPLLFGGKVSQVNTVVRNTSTVDAVLTAFPLNSPATCPANTVTTIPTIALSHFSLSGNGATVVVVMAYPEDPVPNVLNVQNTVTASFSSGSVIGVSSIQSPVTGGDAFGNPLHVTFTGGTALANGVWYVSILTSGDMGITINSNVIANTTSSGVVYTFPYPVKVGISYTVGNGTVQDGTIV